MFGAAMWAKFCNDPLYAHERPNLCSYLRVMFVYMPIMLVVNLAIYTSPLWIAGLLYNYYGPDLLIEIVMWFSWARWPAVFVAGLILALCLFDDAHDEISRVRNEQGISGDIDETDAQNVPEETDHPSFIKLFFQYLKDRHDMVCRQITPKGLQKHIPEGEYDGLL